MQVRFADKRLQRLETDVAYRAGFGPEIVRAFRQRMALIRAAVDERAFYALKSLHYEKLKGDRARERSMRLNKQFRLVLRMEEAEGGRTVVVISVEDYH
ncbi:MAG TPA: type II toxin-antitoxin system RelE/ParE family toxin [Tepidisphaeraceae bacterium]|jgi:proteic killer suppression protein